METVAHTLQSHIVVVEIEAQRDIGVGGPRMPVDRVVRRSLHLVE